MSQVFDQEMEAEMIEGFQLSPQQQRLWKLQQKSAVYRAQLWLAIAGEVSAELLKEALKDVVRRHEILRTLYFHASGPNDRLQVIQDDYDPLWTNIDVSGLPSTEQAARIKELWESELQSTLDPAYGPLLRVSLLTLSPGEQRLLISIAPLCADRRSLNNLIAELSNTYSAFLKGETLDDEPAQYLQFSEWQNELLQDTSLAATYWRQFSLEHLLQPVPFEIKPGRTREFDPQSVTITLDATVLERLNTPLRLAGVNLSVFMQACWQTLLWRHTRQDEFLLGHVFDGRKYEELQQSLGVFARTVPVRCRLHDDLSFWELLAQVDEETKQASKWQAYWSWPLTEQPGEDSGADSHTVETPYLALGFEFVEANCQHQSAGLTFSLVTQSLFNECFKLKLCCAHWSDVKKLELEFQFDPQFLSEQAVNSLVEQFQQLVTSAAEYPAHAIGSLSIIGEAKRQRLAIRNSTSQDYPAPQPWHRLFEEQARQAPNRIALVYESQQLTYRELNERANQLAHYLRQLGVAADSAVGLYLDHSASIIVGLLGICKAGGAYVPLDTRQPIARLTRMLEGTNARVIVSQSSLAKDLPTTTVSVICLDTDRRLLETQSSANMNVQVEMENLAYVIFTSGSTGQPKGVAIEHRQLWNYIQAINDRIDFPMPAAFVTVSTIAADLGNTMIYPCLCFGGTLHLISPDRLSDAAALGDYFAQHEIDCLKIVPSHLEALYRDKQQILPRSRLIVGGEAPRREFLLSLLEEAPQCAIYNHYGPTETTIGVLTNRISKESLENDGPTVGLGEPLGNVQIYILNERMELAGTGETGEIYVGGAGVMRGYIGQPAQTAAKCLPDPFGSHFGGRLYRTGDLARYRPGGDIEFLGRADEQVKLRGFRIELGEIEAALRQHPAVQEAVVIINVDNLERKRLVVYVSTRKAFVTSQELQEFLEVQLPEYMLPSSIVTLDSLPLTANGKIDRQALPSPESQLSLEKKFVAPVTETEKILADIWARVLGVERISIHDNFFELGGDSILNIQVIAQANRRGLRLAPKHLFRHQTVAQLATIVGATTTRNAEQSSVTGAVRLTPMQQVFFENQPANPELLNQYVMLIVRSGTDVGLLEQVLQALLDHHDALRLRFVQEAGEWRQYNAEKEIVSLRRVSLAELQGAAQAEALAREVQAAQESLNLSEGPLVRAVYFELGAGEEGRLLLVVHHLAVDGVSWRILLEDLQSGYEQLRGGAALALPAKTTSYQSWAEQLWQTAQSVELEAEASYWVEQEWEQVRRLRRDYAGGENPVRSARSVTEWLSAEETEVLLREVAAAYHTQINEVLLTGLVRAFNHWSGERVLLVAVEGHGREEEQVEGVDLSRTVGWFTTVYPQLLEAEAGESLATTLKRVKEQVRRTPRRGIGYGMLRYLNEREELREQMRAVGQAEVSFNYLGQFDQVVDAESIFQGAQVSGESTQNDIDARHHLQATQPQICLSVDAMVTGKKLKIMCTYDEAQHRRSTVERLLQLLVEELRDLISARQPPAPEILIASDFPQANLTQAELDTFLSSLNPALPEK